MRPDHEHRRHEVHSGDDGASSITMLHEPRHPVVVISYNPAARYMEAKCPEGQLSKTGVGVEKLLHPKFAKIKMRQDALRTTYLIFWTFCIPRILTVWEETGVFQQLQAISQVCAFPSPFSGSMSDIGMFRQLGFELWLSPCLVGRGIS
jgi:hypothetical protein